MIVSPLVMEWVGFLAAFLTTLAFFPQVVLVWRSGDTKAISLGMYSLFLVGIILWLLYGIYLKSYPMIVANVMTFFMAAYIFGRKLANARRGTDA